MGPASSYHIDEQYRIRVLLSNTVSERHDSGRQSFQGSCASRPRARLSIPVDRHTLYHQDDPLEKLAEIGIMDDIYSNSALNISATSSSSGAGGLFASRNVLSIEPYSYDMSFLYHDCETRGRMIFYDNLWEHDVEEGPLNKRAWVLQERTLAPSLLHFTREQVYWECATLRASETFPNGVLEEFT